LGGRACQGCGISTPDPAQHGVVRWRRIDLRDEIARRFGVTLHERRSARCSQSSVFAASRCARVIRKPTKRLRRHSKNFAATVAAALPGHAQSKPIEIWFQDEARIGQQGTLTRVWARRGSRPRAPRDRRYDWAYLFGAACPERSVAAALVMPTGLVERAGSRYMARRIPASA
jgi:hypothetical protein